ncbi:DUF2303 family protein [Methylomonas sp. 11b]|uniref:DUF2303 family protein n=1 Tax=Methylomonas sp. 11b TaxID=1168169 RepID=UPI00047D6A3A|nr:DUF2303 family protein [Methylomonas sp. 11b]
MDASAIKTISALSVVESQINTLSALDYNVALLPENYKLEGLEKFGNAPIRFRGNYKTTLIDEYIKYVNDHGTPDSTVFVDETTMTSKAIMDLGRPDQPLWGSHKAELSLIKTPEYQAILQYDNTKLEQQALIDFAEDWADNISFFDNQEQRLDFRKTINTLRKLKINANAESEQTVGNYAAARSTLEQVEIKAGQEELPAYFTFHCIPYEGFPLVLFTCQLRAINDQKQVVIKYRIMQLPVKQTEIANCFKDLLQGDIDAEGVETYLGTMNY